MSKASMQLAALVFVLVASAATYLLWPQAGTSEQGASLTPGGVAQDTSSGAKSAIEWDDMGAEGAAQPQSTGPQDRSAVASEPEAERPAMAGEEVPESRITGRVVGPAGQPLEGARFLVAGNDPGPLDLAAGGMGSRWSATSDADGNFELFGPGPGTFRFGARFAGFAPLDKTGLTVTAGKAADVGDLVLQPGVVLDGHVVLRSGAAVVGARLFVERDGQVFFFGEGLSQRASAITDGAGHFRIDELAAGPWRVRVESPGNPTKSFDGAVEFPGGSDTGLVFELEAGATITGRIVGAPAESLAAGVAISARPGTDSSLSLVGFDELAETRDAAVGADGSFVIEGCTLDAEYSLVLFEGEPNRGLWSTRGTSRSLPLVVRGGDAGIELGWVATTALVLDVVDAQTGQPLEDFHVKYGRSEHVALTGAGGQVQDHFSMGRVRLEDLIADPAPEAFTVEVQSLGYRTEMAEFSLAKGTVNQGGRLALTPASLLTFHVLDAKNRLPVEGAKVAVGIGSTDEDTRTVTFDEGGELTREGGRNLVHRGTSDAAGVVRLSSIEGETGVITVQHPNFTDFELAGFAMPTGEGVERELLLFAGGEVLVRALDAEGAPLVGVEVAEREAQPAVVAGPQDGSFSISTSRAIPDAADTRSRTDANGEVRFRHLAPGAQEFRIAKRGAAGQFSFVEFGAKDAGEPWTRVEVAEGGEHELTLARSPRASLSGRVTELGEALAGANVELVAKGGDKGAMRIPGMPSANSTKTYGAGRYEIEGVKLGSYTLEVTHPTRSMPARLELDLDAGQERRDVDLDVAIIEGRVATPEGEPLEGIRVRAKRAGSDGRTATVMMVSTVSSDSGGGTSAMKFSSEPDPAVTDSEGRYVLRGVAPDEAFVVSADGPAWVKSESASMTLKPSEHKSGVDLTLAASGSIQVKLEGFGGMTLAKATYLGDQPDIDDVNQVAMGSEVTLGGLLPGLWEVSLQRLGMLDPEAPAELPAPQQVSVKPGKTEPVTFTM